MPTIQQLPQAVQVNATDEVMLDQSGTSVSASVAQVLAATVAPITLTGDVTGSGNGTIITTLAPVATPGTYSKVSVNAKGLVTAGGAMAPADVISALGYTPYSAANPAGYAQAATLAPVATGGHYSDLTGLPALGSIASQNANAVAITGGSVAGADASAAVVTRSGSSTARTLAARAADSLNVLDYGADPSGVADSAPAFVAAMNAVANGGTARILVPAGTYRLNSFLNQPGGRTIAFEFMDGASITGSGGLGVSRVESRQGPYSLWAGGGGWFGFNPAVGSPQNLAFRTDIIQNTPSNSAASRVAWNRNYANYNYYGKYVSGIDIAEQNIFAWPHLYDNSSGWGHWEVITGTTYDEDSAQRAHVSASAEHSEFDVVNNGPEQGWTWKAGQGTAVQGMSIDPWGQNGNYGGNILFSYGSVGSFDGTTGGLNQRWPAYPAVFSTGNPGPVAQNSTIVITFDATAKATSSLSGSGVGSVSVTAGGGLYTSAPTVVFSGGGGTGAAGTATMLGGSVVGVAITSAGSGYITAPSVSFTGGGVALPVATTVTLNPDGAHGDLASVAAAINAAGVAPVRASVARWGGVVNRLVIFGTAAMDLGTLTLGGTALGTLGIAAQSYSTPRDSTVVVFGGSGSCLPGDKLTLNGTVVTVGGTGSMADVVAAITAANIIGVKADTVANGNLVLTCWVPQNPGGFLISQPSGYTTLGKLGLVAGQFWPPTPPKGFASAAGELTSPVCQTTDRVSIAATDLNGTTYGPVTVQLNGGAGTGWVADVASSIQSALVAAGFFSAGNAMLSTPPAVVAVVAKGAGSNQGLLIRNTAGGTLTLANVQGTPLQTLGIQPGTYQPGGMSAASQSVFMAAPDSIAPQGRGIFIGGAGNATDRTVWPHAPLEARGSFLHGLRTDKAVFDDNAAVLVGGTQAISFGGAVNLTATSTQLQVNGASVALASDLPTRVSQLANDSGFLTSVPVTAVAGRTGAVTLGTADIAGFSTAAAAAAPVQTVAGRAGAVTLGTADIAGFTTGAASAAPVQSVAGRTGAVTLGTADIAGFSTAAAAAAPVQSVFGRTGAVTLASADVTGALGYTPVSNAGGTIAGTVAFSGTATAATQAAADNSTRLATTAFVYQATAAASSIATTGGSTTLTAAQYGAPVLIATGALTSAATFVVPGSGVWTLANRTTGAFTLTVKTAAGSGIVVDQGYTAEVVADGTNVVLATTDFNAIALQGVVSNLGTINGGTVSPVALVAGSAGSVVTVSQLADAGGYHPVVLANRGANTNIPMVLAPAGAGYIAAAVSNAAASGGNQRGQYSVDWQQARATAAQVASGAYAAVPGGSGNTAGGNYSLAAGQGSTATGQGSVALGQFANDGGAYGKLVFSANANTVGNQWGVSTLYVSSVATATRMTSDGAAAGSANSIPIRSNHVIAGTLTVSARNVANGDGAYWSIPVLFKNSAGTVTVTSPGASGIAPSSADSTLSTASIAIAADNTNKGLSVTITPPVSVTVNASAVFLATEM